MTAPASARLRGDGIRVHRAEDGQYSVQIRLDGANLMEWQIPPLNPGESFSLGPVRVELDVTLTQ